MRNRRRMRRAAGLTRIDTTGGTFQAARRCNSGIGAHVLTTNVRSRRCGGEIRTHANHQGCPVESRAVGIQLDARARRGPAVVVVSDIRLYREGLEQALNADGRVLVTATSASVAAALECLTQDVQVVLIDVGLANAMAAINAVRRATSARIVALGVANSDTDILAYAEAGVDGYVARDASLDQLIETVASAVRGELQCSPRIAASLLRRIGTLATRSHTPHADSITRREQQILALLRTGRSNKEIASQLSIEVATVKNHVHNILSKLGARRRSELAGRSFETIELRD